MVDDAGGIRYAAHDGAHLTYRRWGAGPPLVYVHSQFLPISVIDEEPAYERFVAGLATFATVIVFDRRGIGLSDPMRDEPTVEDWAAQLESVLDAAEVDGAYLLGHGWGALPAVTLAATRPARVRGLVLAMAVGAPGTAGDSLIDDLLASARPSHPSTVVDGLTLLSPSRAGDVAFRKWWDSAGQRGASPAVAQQLLALQATADVSALLPAVRVPTLVIDRPKARRWVRGSPPFGTAIEGARLVEVDGIDTLIWLSDSDAVVAEIDYFITGERHPTPSDRRLLTLMFSDIVGSTTAAAQMGDDRWRDVLAAHHRLVRTELARHGGTEVDTAGDGFLSTFATPSDAARCAERLHRAMVQLGIELRVGIHCGETTTMGDHIAGIALHIAARVQSKATPAQTWVTTAVREAMTGSEFTFEATGEHELKGVPGSWCLFAINR